jgi:type VI secretion system secreted protein Hcp
MKNVARRSGRRLGWSMAAVMTVMTGLLSAPSFAASDIFLIIDNIQPQAGTPLKLEGESRDTVYPGAIEVESFSFGAENPTTIGSATGGAGTGRAKFQNLTVTLPASKASPQLFKMCALGQNFRVVLAVRKSGASATSKPMEYLKYTLGTCFINSYQVSASKGDDRVKDQVSIAYGQMIVEYRPQMPDGTLATTPVKTTWNQLTNTEKVDATLGQ